MKKPNTQVKQMVQWVTAGTGMGAWSDRSQWRTARPLRVYRYNESKHMSSHKVSKIFLWSPWAETPPQVLWAHVDFSEGTEILMMIIWWTDKIVGGYVNTQTIALAGCVVTWF